MQSSAVKQLKSATYCESNLHYGLGDDLPISKQHLLSIILRCDWTILCTKFSSTFRKLKPYESLSSVKQRNSEYAIWSRLIRETVEYYGQRGFGDYNNTKYQYDNKIVGPFYCGINCMMNIPSFNIRICSPQSVSKQISVATRFAGNHGMILALNNNGHCNIGGLRIFNCSWISNYHGEDEYLFAGGRYQIRLENIRDVYTKENYYKFCKVLFYFDCMIKGTTMNQMIDFDIKDFQILYKIINNGDCNISNNKYIMNTFQCMVSHSREVVINLHQILSFFHIKDEIEYKMKLIDLLIIRHGMMKGSQYSLNMNTIKLFSNIEHIMIYSTKQDGSISYRISISNLLSIGCQKITICASRHHKHQNTKSWLGLQYDLLKTGNDSKIEIEFLQGLTSEELIEDRLIIQRIRI